MDYFPVFLRLQGQPVLVVGGGGVAARKIELLLRAGAAVTVVSPGLCSALSEKAAGGKIIHLAAEFRPEHLVGVRLAIAATNREAVNAWVAYHAERLQVPVNVVDDRVHSSFIVPAIIDRSPVVVAVSSGGEAPVLTRRLRERFETLLPNSLGTLASIAGRWRNTVKKRLQAPGARRRFWENFFDGPLAADILAGRTQDAPHDSATFAGRAPLGEPVGASISRAISRAALQGEPLGEVTLVGAGPGDPGLLTLRGLRALQDADVVLYDRLVSAEVLDLARRDADRIDVGKSAGGDRVAQQDINALMVRLAREGKRVCRLKGGDPFIFGRGGEELEALARAGIRFQVVPGITAAMGCAAYAGIPLTHRDHAQVVTFVTGHTRDSEGEEAAIDWRALAQPAHTLVIYMGLRGLRKILARLQEHGVPSDRAAAIVEQGTHPGQRVLTGTLATLADEVELAGVQSPALLIVGEVTRLHAVLHWFNESAQHDAQLQPLGLHGRLSA